MCNVTINFNKCECKACRLRATTEVTGDDADIKREFERIERACQLKQDSFVSRYVEKEMKKACQHKMGWELKHKADAQTKTPSVGADGV